jgi:hypothetical protein
VIAATSERSGHVVDEFHAELTVVQAEQLGALKICPNRVIKLAFSLKTKRNSFITTH